MRRFNFDVTAQFEMCQNQKSAAPLNITFAIAIKAKTKSSRAIRLMRQAHSSLGARYYSS